MRVKKIIDERFQDYKLPSMFLAAHHCDFKCCKEAGIPPEVCQNNPILSATTIDVPPEELLIRYTSNPITKAVVIGGLEPWLQIEEVIGLIEHFRSNGVMDDFVIYTGYDRSEVEADVSRLKQYPNIVVKFGRYKPDAQTRHDDVLGVLLASDNQYAERIS